MKNLKMELPVKISQFLPHREPMLMVDYVVGLDNESIETNFKIEKENIFIEDGLFNETGVIENAAQTCSGIVGWSHFEDNTYDESYRVEGFISSIQRVEIMSLPPVGSVIQTKGELLSMHKLGDIYHCKMDCKTFLNDEEIAHSIFTLIIRP